MEPADHTASIEQIASLLVEKLTQGGKLSPGAEKLLKRPMTPVEPHECESAS